MGTIQTMQTLHKAMTSLRAETCLILSSYLAISKKSLFLHTLVGFMGRRKTASALVQLQVRHHIYGM
ncbi:hypothetical protein AD928_00820 [Acetobacter cerevisiae]|uniref:Uncharacterized protein n=1 Tax=Acetobacter cerevisiae TaxID=178900 RepID=A0A149QYX9_9PROT|nr:hypothetical protein AD928_00820 [Acetobacter cerevisiae]